MGVGKEWPDYMPTVDLSLTVTSGSLTVGATSKVVNYDKYSWSPDQLTAAIFKNGSLAQALDIDSSDGDITLGSAIAVSEGDEIEARFHFVDKLSLDWYTRFIGDRTCFMTVGAGDSTTTFDDSTNTMPVPSFDMAFGWDGTDKLKVGVKVNNKNGASEDMSLKTRLLASGGAQESSTTIDLDDTTNAQTHTSSFDSTDVEVACEMEFKLDSGTSTPKVRDTARIVIVEVTEVPDYPNFPTTGTMLEQRRPGGLYSPRFAEPV